MQPDDKPPPYSEVSPPGQEYHPEMQGAPVTSQPAPQQYSAAQGAPGQPPYAPGHGNPAQAPYYPGVPPHSAGQEGMFVADQSRVPLMSPAPGPGGSYGSVTYVTQMPAHEVIIVGGCPACRIGVLEDDYSCLGIFCAIFFFPLGILCCLATRQRRCPNCGAIFG